MRARLRLALATAFTVAALVVGLAFVNARVHGVVDIGTPRLTGFAAAYPIVPARLAAGTNERVSIGTDRAPGPLFAGSAVVALACASLLGWCRVRTHGLSVPRRHDFKGSPVRGPPGLILL